jgi:hypothetical protein
LLKDQVEKLKIENLAFQEKHDILLCSHEHLMDDHCRRFDPGGVPGPTSKIVAACPSPDGLARDGTQGGETRLVLSCARGCAHSRGYKRSRGRESEPVRQPVLPRDPLA